MSNFNQNQQQLAAELQQLKRRLPLEAKSVLKIAEQCVSRAERLFFPLGELHAKLLMSHACWCLMDYRRGLKIIKEAQQLQSKLDCDDFLPEILHIHALHYWGQGKYFSAQQFWINALEQAALVEETEIQIESLLGLGNVWRMTQEYALAASTHELAVSVANTLRIEWLEGKARILLAWDYYLLGNYAEMLTVLDGVSDLLREHPDPTWEAEIWDFRGLALLGLERLDAAEEATKKAHQLAITHDLAWMRTHSYISRARLYFLQGEAQTAMLLLENAERAAQAFDHGELLSQICYQQSVVAETLDDYSTAYHAFSKYRLYSRNILRDQTNAAGLDKARNSKRQLEQRARKLINRIRSQYEYNPEKQFSNVVSENYWWEQLVLAKSQMQNAPHAVITMQSRSSEKLDVCLELAHSVSSPTDLISRLSHRTVAMLIKEEQDSAEQLHDILKTMLHIHPWHRRGATPQSPVIALHDILTFPFTIEQLEQITPQSPCAFSPTSDRQSQYKSQVVTHGKFA
ncbi:hypothetical protein [Vibrio agarilyticus]|uniref:hypothetical protein n=1 Tax=Vibrio agarilyticus TaxID=2726741 RepID=UPI001FE6A335|nr:hypothetical protein [Vibrio agarilyticus]